MNCQCSFAKAGLPCSNCSMIWLRRPFGTSPPDCACGRAAMNTADNASEIPTSLVVGWSTIFPPLKRPHTNTSPAGRIISRETSGNLGIEDLGLRIGLRSVICDWSSICEPTADRRSPIQSPITNRKSPTNHQSPILKFVAAGERLSFPQTVMREEPPDRSRRINFLLRPGVAEAVDPDHADFRVAAAAFVAHGRERAGWVLQNDLGIAAVVPCPPCERLRDALHPLGASARSLPVVCVLHVGQAVECQYRHGTPFAGSRPAQPRHRRDRRDPSIELACEE